MAEPEDRGPKPGIIRAIGEKLFIMEVPSYGNKLFYSLGFLGLTCLAILGASGIVMVFFGPNWWLTSQWGIFFRSVHLWAVEAFFTVIILHGLVVLATSGFKAPRRLTWVIGATAFIAALFEAEFGYGLRGDFSSQYRVLQAADFWNGSYLGRFINALNYTQIYGIHVIVIPAVIAGLLVLHYLLVKIRGIAKPYRSDFPYTMQAASHVRLFIRGGVLAAIIVLLAIVFPSPLIEPTTIQQVATSDPSTMAQTLMAEFAGTSDTATYMDSIDPYTYSTRDVYVAVPYGQYAATSGAPNELAAFAAEPAAEQQANIDRATAYFGNGDGSTGTSTLNEDPLIPVINTLVSMAQSGLYESAVDGENPAIRPTYSLRFLADTGVLDAEASQLHITTDQWGMMREEHGILPPGAWWLAPLGVLDHTVLANDGDGDRDGALTLGILALLFVLFPYIPYLNRLPEKLHIAEFIWKP